MGSERRTDLERTESRIDPFARTPRDRDDGDTGTADYIEDTGGTPPVGGRDPFAGDTDTRRDNLDDSRPAKKDSNDKAMPSSAGGTAAIARGSEPDVPKRDESAAAPLLASSEASKLKHRWEECQQHFVDEPKASVESADELVAEVMQKVASQFAATRESLEQQWDRGDRVSTEDLRLAMQKYRDFFNRLLAA